MTWPTLHSQWLERARGQMSIPDPCPVGTTDKFCFIYHHSFANFKEKSRCPSFIKIWPCRTLSLCFPQAGSAESCLPSEETRASLGHGPALHLTFICISCLAPETDSLHPRLGEKRLEEREATLTRPPRPKDGKGQPARCPVSPWGPSLR